MHFILLQILSLTWRLGDDFCIAYRYFYYCFLFFLPLTLVFLAWHLFVENCKWNFAGEEGAVPRYGQQPFSVLDFHLVKNNSDPFSVRIVFQKLPSRSRSGPVKGFMESEL